MQLPPNLPEGLFFYPDAYLGGAEETASSTVRTIILTLVTEDPVPEVIAWYTTTLESNTWSVSVTDNVLSAQKDTLNIRIEAITEENASEVSILQTIEVAGSAS